MLELFDTHPDIQVQESEFKRLLGYPARHPLEGRAREIAEATRKWYAENGRPWIYARQAESLAWDGDKLNLNGAGFSSQPLREQFSAAKADSALFLAVSAGPSCEEKARELWQEGKPDEYFFMEMFGSAVVEHLVAFAHGQICGWADQNGWAALPHYSPGYTGWDIADQTRLWELIKPAEVAKFPGELDVLETGMLRPKKSLLAVVGLTRHLDKVRATDKLVPCENCSLPRCQYRRAPYAHYPPQFEEVGRLQPGGNEIPLLPDANPPALNHHAKYSVNLKALRKWSQERLHLELLPDDSVQARFRYQGTTCTNLGRSLEFDYHLLLAPERERYKIVEASCAPAPGDAGHTCQCEYLKDAASFMRAIAGERPLLGRPLDDVLVWERAYSPSGCYCDSERRMHKWGLVYEVVHFALAQRAKEKNGHHFTTTVPQHGKQLYDQTL